jgi:hypothetical protein
MKEKIVGFRVSKDVKKMLDSECERLKMSPSEFMRMMVFYVNKADKATITDLKNKYITDNEIYELKVRLAGLEHKAKCINIQIKNHNTSPEALKWKKLDEAKYNKKAANLKEQKKNVTDKVSWTKKMLKKKENKDIVTAVVEEQEWT